MRSRIFKPYTLTCLLLCSCTGDELVLPDESPDADPQLDARVVLRDAGSKPARDAVMDASAPSARDAATRDAGPDGGIRDGVTPHGCYRAKSDNPADCPANVYEQSAGYPPTEEWKGCDTSWYVPCVYSHPPAEDVTCVCDLGFHWICSY